MRRALLGVDLTPTFCEGGGLPVEGGHATAARVAELLDAHGQDYELLVFSEDWHIDPGPHWVPEGTEPDFATSWPKHGPAGTDEARVHPDVRAALDRLAAAGAEVHLVRKGMFAAAYSAFEGIVVENDPDELEPMGPPLADWLRQRGITHLDVVGIATDHCVRASALDAVREGFEVRLLDDLVAGVAPDTTAAALDEMAAAGVERSSTRALGLAPGAGSGSGS